MLTRRHIRIKVMQSVYSFALSKNLKLDDEVLFFKQSVAQSFDLYLLILGLIKALGTYAKEQIDAYQKHGLSLDDNYEKLQKLSQNSVLVFFQNHTILEQHLKNKKFIRWDLEFKYLKEITNEIISTDFFNDYVNIEFPNEAEDKNCIVKIFKNKIAPSDYLQEHIQDHRLTWTDDFPLINTYFLKELKQLNINDSQSLRFPKPIENDEDLEFGINLLEKVISNDAQLQSELKGKTPNWDEQRIAQLDNVLLKIAIAELLFFPTIPVNVSLNEYLEIAKDYSTPKSNHFVNGVLDKLVKEFETEKRLNKKGRGLL